MGVFKFVFFTPLQINLSVLVAVDCEGGVCPNFDQVIPDATCDKSSSIKQSSKSVDHILNKSKELQDIVKPFLINHQPPAFRKNSVEECPLCWINSWDNSEESEIDDCYKGNVNDTDTCSDSVDSVCGMYYTATTELSVETLEQESRCYMNRQCGKDFLFLIQI